MAAWHDLRSPHEFVSALRKGWCTRSSLAKSPSSQFFAKLGHIHSPQPELGLRHLDVLLELHAVFLETCIHVRLIAEGNSLTVELSSGEWHWLKTAQNELRQFSAQSLLLMLGQYRTVAGMLLTGGQTLAAHFGR